MALRVAINGFGRIGRAFFKVASKRPEIEIVAVNDLGDIENMAYLLRHDSVYGQGNTFDVSVRKEGVPALIVGGREVAFISEKEPTKLPWKALDVDVVVESTGFFTSPNKARMHLEAGAKRVVISAPMKDEGGDAATILLGINEEKFPTCKISSNASCTTNSASPVIKILDEAIGVEKALLSTVHGYTASQAIVDGPNKKDWKEGRAAAINIVPTSTGAAIAVTKAITSLERKFDGISFRVPVSSGSIADITFIAKRATSVEEVNQVLKNASNDPRWKGIFSITEEELVSSDILGNSHASIADLGLTRVVDGNLVKVCSWYDNEMGYTHALVEHVVRAGAHLS